MPTIDEDLLRRLPLPLAQLYRRAHNAKNALERHQAAYYLWEAGLKLLGSLLVVEYAELGDRDPELAARLENLARPALGHWWEFIRRLLPLLAEAHARDESLGAAREFLLGRTRDDLPRAAGLLAALDEALVESAGGPRLPARSSVRLSELFEALVRYRNRELGHGAAGQRPPVFYERLGLSLLAGVGELLGRVDLLLGRRLLFVSDVRRRPSGDWLVERFELAGEAPRRLESLEVVAEHAGELPRPGWVYVEKPLGTAAGGAAGAVALRPLHPLVLFDADAGEFFFLSSRRGQSRIQYLSYTSGRTVEREDTAGERQELLAAVLGRAVDPEALEAWAQRTAAGEPRESSEAARPRRAIGEFELLSRIGRGGMGVVYRAWQPSLGRQVALKCLIASGDPKVEARFAREIRSLGRVEHPNLVKVFTSGADGEQWFYAMELIEGADLASVCEQLAVSSASAVGAAEWRSALTSAREEARRREESVSPGWGGEAGAGTPVPREVPHAGLRPDREHIEQVVDVVRQAAGAAHALHEAGIVHRDIKPGNIMLTADGAHAVLMDLGLAQLADDAEGRLTRTRQFVGTLRYASPEQLLAAGSLDRRSDVYSLGATLWELLTLRPLFGAGEETPTPELMLRIQTAEPQPPRRLNPKVPPDLEAVVLKCLEKDPARRYGSAAELALDLGRWRRGEPVSAQAPTVGYLLRKQVRRHKTRFALAGVLLLAAVLGAAFAVHRIDRARRAAQAALYDMYTTSGVAADEANDPATAILWFANAARVAPDAEKLRASLTRVRNWRRQVPRPVRAFQLEMARSGAVDVVFDPSGAYLLARGAGGEAAVWSLEDEKEVAFPGGKRPVAHCAWGPAGDLFAVATVEGTLELFSFPSGRLLRRLAEKETLHDLAFSPGGRHLAFAGERFRLWDLEAGTFTAELPHPSPARRLTFNSRGDRLATAADDERVRVFALPPGERPEPLFEPLPHLTPRFQLAVPPIAPALVDGDRGIVTLTARTEATWWDAERGEPVGRLAGTVEEVTRFVSSAGGSSILLLAARTGVATRLYSLTHGRPAGMDIRHHQYPVHAAAFSPDGARFATLSSEAVKLWELDRAVVRQQHASYRARLGLSLRSPAPSSMAYSPDGRFLALASASGLVRVLDVGHDGVVKHHLRPGVHNPVLSPDGRHVMSRGFTIWAPLRVARVYQLATGQAAGPPLDAGGILTGAAFHPDSRRAVTLAARVSDPLARQVPGYRPDQTPGEVRFWDWRSGEQVASPLLAPAEPIFAAYGLGGAVLVVLCAGGHALLIDGDRGRLRGMIEHASGRPASQAQDGEIRFSTVRLAEARAYDASQAQDGEIRFSPDGRRFATRGLGSTVKVWDAASGSIVWSLEHAGTNCYALRFSRDGRYLAVGSSGNLLSIWDITTGERAAPPIEHPASVFGVEFGADSSYVLTACGDDRVRVWDWRRGVLAGPNVEVPWLAGARFTPGGRRVLALADLIAGGALGLWELESGKPIAPRLYAPVWPKTLLSPEGEQAVLTGPRTIALVGLRELEELPALSMAAGLTGLAELLSFQKLSERGGLAGLTAAEWLERWQALRREEPEAAALDLSRDAQRAWHRRQSEHLTVDERWDAAAWHLERLAELGEDVRRERDRLDEFVRAWRFAALCEPWLDLGRFVEVDEARLRAIEESALAVRLAVSPQSRVDFAAAFPEHQAYAVGYALREVLCDAPRRVRIIAGADDWVRVWLNRKLVLQRDVFSPAFPDQVSGTAELEAGRNRLLVEVSNGPGAWELFLRLEDEDGRKLRLTSEGRLEPLALEE
jgi:serine/threonine protein kinase/WD40 repeat protein